MTEKPDDRALSDTYWEAVHSAKERKNEVCHHAGLRAVLDRWGCRDCHDRHELEALALDAVSALRYIEDSYGRLYGVGWERVFDAAKLLSHTSKEEKQ